MSVHPPFDEPEPPPEVRPLRWIGALAFFGVVCAALTVLALEAIDDSFTWIGDGQSQSDAVVLATDPPPPEDDAGEAAGEGAGTGGSVDGGSDGGGTADGDTASDDAGGGDESDDDTAAAPPALYEVQPGDTGTSIAQDLLGEQEAWARIAELNGISTEAVLSVGQTLRIPDE